LRGKSLKAANLSGRDKRLKHHLDRLLAGIQFKARVKTDPLSHVERFRSPEDMEVAGFIAAAIAYGNVKIILQSLANVDRVMGARPRRFAETFTPGDGAFSGFVHRFHKAGDIAYLVTAAKRMIERSGSIENFFKSAFEDSGREMGKAISCFTSRIFKLKGCEAPSAAVTAFLSDPLKGSACKRLNLYLRWMVRTGVPDTGAWKSIPASCLVIPLDTHVARICQMIGLTGRKTPDWKMAREISDKLRSLDPDDPIKYDFAISHMGISRDCTRRRAEENCRRCELKLVCEFMGS
jgi:uncharacterized protein (TIGR02757 family)